MGFFQADPKKEIDIGLAYVLCSFSSILLIEEIQVQSPESFATLRTDRMMPTHINPYKLFFREHIKMENLILHTR